MFSSTRKTSETNATNKLQMFKTNINNSRQQEHLSYCFCNNVSPNINKLWLLLCYLRVPFQLASPPGIHVTHIPKGKLVLLYINVFFWHFGIFFSPGRGWFLVLSTPWHSGSPPRPRAHVWALAEVWGTCSGGSKWPVPSGRDFEHVEPSRPLQTREQVNRMSAGSCDIWDLECHQCRQTLLTW